MKKYKEILFQFLRYAIVGGIAFVVDAGSLWIMGRFINYLIAAAIAFILGLIANFVLSKLFVFTDQKKNKVVEFISYGIIGVIGLGITELLMWLLTDKLGLYFIISKIITAVIVLIWNYAARKILLYREK